MSVKYNKHRTEFKDVSRALVLGAADVPTTVGLAYIPAMVGHTIYVQRIAVHVLTAAAQTLTFQDTAGTPKVIARMPASAAVGDLHVLLDEPEGVPLTEGKALDIVGLAGVAGTIAITAFQKLTGVVTAAQLASA